MNSDHSFEESDKPTTSGQSSLLAAASVVLAVLSLFSCMIAYFAIPCASLSILCALLSRGKTQMKRKAKLSLVFSVCAMAFSVTFTSYLVYALKTDAALRQEAASLFNHYAYSYGLEGTFDTYFGTWFPDSGQKPLVPSHGGDFI